MTINLTVKVADKSGHTATRPVSIQTTTVVPTQRPYIGMSAPSGTWAQRLSEVQATGGRIQARRIFFASLKDTSQRALVEDAISNGYFVVISFKLGHPWGQIASGQWDSELNSVKSWLATLDGDVFVCLNHEPGKVGHNPVKTDDAESASSTPADFANMCLHAIPILKSAGSHVSAGVIMNGWMFIGSSVTSGPSGNGYSDAELAQWLPPSLVVMCDVIAADHYQTQSDGEHPATRMKRHYAWAHRVGARGVGVGEFNDFTAQGITDLCNITKAEPLARFICQWNNATSAAGILSDTLDGGEKRLTAFRNALLTWNQPMTLVGV